MFLLVIPVSCQNSVKWPTESQFLVPLYIPKALSLFAAKAMVSFCVDQSEYKKVNYTKFDQLSIICIHPIELTASTMEREVAEKRGEEKKPSSFFLPSKSPLVLLFGFFAGHRALDISTCYNESVIVCNRSLLDHPNARPK